MLPERRTLKVNAMPLSRLYNTTADAVGAVEALKQAGFDDHLIQFVAQGAVYIGGESLMRAGVLRGNAERYATAIRAGATLLIVDAPLGSGASVAEILEAPRPSDTGNPKVVYEGGSWDEAAPMSSAMQMPVLSDSAAPLSAALGLPVLSKEQGPNDWSLGAPTLLANQRGRSTSLGFATLSRDQRGPSVSFGLATLSKNQRGPASFFGLPTLLKNQRGKAGLLNNPAPLSAILGIPLLIEHG
jgi:hypothetical protein